MNQTRLDEILKNFLNRIILKKMSFVDEAVDVKTHESDDSKKITMDIIFLLNREWCDIMIHSEYQEKIFSGEPISVSELNKYTINSAVYEQQMMRDNIVQFLQMIGTQVDFRKKTFNITYVINPNSIKI